MEGRKFSSSRQRRHLRPRLPRPLRRRRAALLHRRRRAGEPGHRLHLGGVPAPQQRRARRRLGQPGQPHGVDGGEERRRRPDARRADRRRPRPAGDDVGRVRARSATCSARNRQKAAANEAMRVVGEANKYLSDQAPWKLKEDPARRDTVLHTALQAIKDCNALLTPFLPHSSQQVHELLGGTGVWSVAPRDPRGHRPRRRLAVPDHHRPLRPGAGRLGVHAAARAGHAAGAADAGLHQARRLDRRGGAARLEQTARADGHSAGRCGREPVGVPRQPAGRAAAVPGAAAGPGAGQPHPPRHRPGRAAGRRRARRVGVGRGRRRRDRRRRRGRRPAAGAGRASTSPSSRWSAALAARHPNVLAAVALHPNEAGAGSGDRRRAGRDRPARRRCPGCARWGRPASTGTAPAPRAGRRRRRRSARTSGSPRSTASRWSSTTGTRTTRSCGCSRTRARRSTPSSTASPATPRSPRPASSAATCCPSPAP